MDPADVPTIEQILDDFGIPDILGPNSYGQLLAELQQRESTMVEDLAKTLTKQNLKKFVNLANVMIDQV
jgi:hypothetical protein